MPEPRGRSKNGRALAAAALVLSLLVGCERATEQEEGDAHGGAPSPQDAPGCSAAGLPSELPAQDLPPRVAAMRERIVAAAVTCDYDELERLALEGRPGFSFSFGAPEGGPAAYWREEEASEDGAPLAKLVHVLAAPHGTLDPLDGEELFVWPSIFGKEKPGAEDWKTIESIYPADDVARMEADAARFGIGYLGYRAGITGSGDWIYFIAGD